MIYAILFLLALLIYGGIQIHSYQKQQLKKDMIIFLCIMILDATLGTLMILNVPLPHAGDLLLAVFRPIGKIIMG